MGWGNTVVIWHPSTWYLLEEIADMIHFLSNRGFCNPLLTQSIRPSCKSELLQTLKISFTRQLLQFSSCFCIAIGLSSL